jgi:hypothetical protein
LAQAAGLSDSEVKKIAREIAESLMGNYGMNEAALIFEQYLDSPEEAVGALLSGGNYEEALRVVCIFFLFHFVLLAIFRNPHVQDAFLFLFSQTVFSLVFLFLPHFLSPPSSIHRPDPQARAPSDD